MKIMKTTAIEPKTVRVYFSNSLEHLRAIHLVLIETFLFRRMHDFLENLVTCIAKEKMTEIVAEIVTCLRNLELTKNQK